MNAQLILKVFFRSMRTFAHKYRALTTVYLYENDLWIMLRISSFMTV